jgi:TIR domain
LVTHDCAIDFGNLSNPGRKGSMAIDSASAEEKSEYSAFISYASADRDAAVEMVQSLESKGLKCWVAPRDVRPGAEYAQEIIRGIESSKCFVLLLSKAANLSSHVTREVERAASKAKPIYPVRVEEVLPSPRLEYFISMHHWIDAWDGTLASHVLRLANAMDSGEEWIGNVLLKRRRRQWMSGGIATAVALLALILAVVFGADIRGLLRSEKESARHELATRNVPLDVEGLTRAISAADGDRLALFAQAGISPSDISSAFGQLGVAGKFFAKSKNSPEALKWFASVAKVIDPNMTIPDDYYGKIGILSSALHAGNKEAALSLINAGASPYVYENLWFTWYSIPEGLFPYTYLLDYKSLSATDKADLAKAFVEVGASVSIPEYKSTDGYTPEQLEAVIKSRDQIKARYNVDVPTTSTICEAKETEICRAAADRSGFDWCEFARSLPKTIEGKDSDIYEFTKIDLIQLVNVVDDTALVLANLFGGWRPGYGLVEIPKDQSTWTVYKFATPAAGMGLCKKDEGGFVRDECWRRVVFSKKDDKTMSLMDYYSYAITACP